MTHSARSYSVVALLLVAACGADGESSTTSEPPSTTIVDSTTTNAEPGEQSVDVFFGVDGSPDCAEVQAFPRQTQSGQDPIQGAFEALLAGPFAAESGATSWFSAETADSLRSVTLVDGVLTIDLADLSSIIPGASSSCGSAAFLAQLQATGFQFAEVQEIVFQFEGSCDSFFGFLQMECTVTRRPA
jgi:spore germination protein GerM